MLYWICPECGRECSPAIRECPTCAAAEKAVSAVESSPEQTSTDILSLAQNFRSASPAGLSSATARLEATVAVITAEPEEEPARAGAAYDAAIDSLVKAPRAASSKAVQSEVLPVPPGASAPALVAAKSPRAESRLKLGDLAPIGDIDFQAALLRLPKAQEQSVEPAPSRRRSVAFVRQALPGVHSSGLALAGFAQPGEAWPTPPKSGNETTNETNAAPIGPKAGGLAFISSKLDLAGQSISDLLHALEKSAEELELAAIHAIQASFREQPAEPLLCAPHEIVTAPAPPSEQWMRSRVVFSAKAPGNAGLAILTAGPQTPTLAGPCLPPELRNFIESGNGNQRAARKSTSAPTWMVSVLVAMGVFLGAGAVFQYLASNRDAKAASVAAALAKANESAPAAPLPVAEEHPGARFVEVAGLRVVTAPNRKPQLQYLVINHSAGELTGLNIRIALHSADSPSGAPLIRVSSIVPSLGPNQSKEIRMDLDAGLSAASIPDWKSLRTEILVARQ